MSEDIWGVHAAAETAGDAMITSISSSATN